MSQLDEENDPLDPEQPTFEQPSDNFYIFFALVGIIVILWIVAWFLSLRILPDWGSRSSFGEMFGSINALFSGLALAGIIYAIHLQRKELALQKYELRLTREELKRTATAQENSERSLERQAESLATTARLNSLHFLPIITCDVVIGGSNKIYIRVSNPSNVYAFDIAGLMLAVFEEEKVPASAFIKRHMDDDTVTRAYPRFRADKNGIYSAQDYFKYQLLPPRKYLQFETVFPETPDSVYVFLQYRDMQRNNYHQLSWFYQDFLDPKRYVNDFVIPSSLEVFPRIEIRSQDSRQTRTTSIFKLSSDDGGPVPRHLKPDFVYHLRCSIPPHDIDPLTLFANDRLTLYAME